MEEIPFDVLAHSVGCVSRTILNGDPELCPICSVAVDLFWNRIMNPAEHEHLIETAVNESCERFSVEFTTEEKVLLMKAYDLALSKFPILFPSVQDYLAKRLEGIGIGRFGDLPPQIQEVLLRIKNSTR